MRVPRRHPNVVRLYEVIDAPDAAKLYMVLEYVGKGPIMNVKPNGPNTPLPHETCRGYTRDILCGLDYLHFNNITHRDIKPDNLLALSLIHI